MKKLVEIETPLPAGTLVLQRMRAKEELGRLSEYELDLLSSSGPVKLDAVLGKSVTVKLQLEDDKERTFSGYVTRFSLVDGYGRYQRYHATVRPWLWFLTRTTNCRIFQGKKVPQILKEVFEKHPGIADVKFELTDSYTPWDYCVQYRETDFHFVSRLMEDEGIYYFFRHQEGRHTLVVADSASAHPIANVADSTGTHAGAGKIPFIPPEKLARVERGHVSQWSMTHELQPGRYALTDYDFEKPSVNLQVRSRGTREHAMADYEIYDYPGAYLDRGDGELYARTRVEELQAKFERVHGTTNARGLATGELFTLTSHPHEDQNGEYLVVSAEYEVTSNENQAGEAMGGEYSCRFSALNSHQQFRPERLTPKPIVHGPQTAITVGPNGETIHTDKFGRVKIQFHWDRYGQGNDESSCWIRVSQNWGGKGWGGMFIPHVGQEVIVQFLEGDPDSPIITGRVYNAENMPPVALPAGKTQSVIRDHGSNQIIMEGEGGTQRMTIFSPTSSTWITIGAPDPPE
jgi:type VI secretion system secreted protein VgrG